MAKTFYVQKKSGTYSDILEAYGLGNLLNKILNSVNSPRARVTIKDNGGCYELESSAEITPGIIEKVSFFYLFKFIIKETDKTPEWIDKSSSYDFSLNKKVKDERREQEKTIRENKDITNEQKIQQVKQLRDSYNSPQAFKIDKEYDVYNELRKNSYNYFINKFEIIHRDKSEKRFHILLNEILNYYSIYQYSDKKLSAENKATKTLRDSNIVIKDSSNAQIINPNHGQGVYKSKSNGLNRDNPPSFWINELMKISGALECNCMICQTIAVGSKYDLKVYVPEVIQSDTNWIKSFIMDFKNNLKSNTPIRIDILNILHLIRKFIEKSPEYIGEVHNTVKGLHSVYQKQLSADKTKPRTVLNISFISVPKFITIQNQEESYNWLDIINEQIKIIGNIGRKKGKITEDGATIQGLMLYRTFISGSDIYSFFDFAFWYAQYLSSQLSKNEYTQAFSIETLNQFYKCMDTNELKLTEIITDAGFKAVANAIRESTIVLQTIASLKKQGKAKDYQLEKLNVYSIRYGVAQVLQSKSKSTKELAEFIGEFIALYNAETAGKSETKGKSFRANVREDELYAFYNLLEQSKSSKLVGALLASYGFALKAKDTTKPDEQEENLIEESIED